MSKPTGIQAAVTSAVLSLLFLLVYGACNWLTSHRNDVGVWCYSWEQYVPLVPLMIVPYMSLDLFFVGAPFLCQSRDELRTLAKRLVFAILVASVCFLLLPLELAVARPQPSGWTSSAFALLQLFDQPYNLFPSLHITLTLVVAQVYLRHVKGRLRGAMVAWFSLVALSTLLTWQHHFIDVIGGLVLAILCFYLFREEMPKLIVMPNPKISFCYASASIAAFLLGMLAPPWTTILFWPAISLGIVAGGYAGLGPAIYRKANGHLPLSVRILLAPALLGQHLSLLYYRCQSSTWSSLTPNILIGAKPKKREAIDLRNRGVTAVLDLTAEFSEPAALLDVAYCNIPVLDLTQLSREQLQQGVDFIGKYAGTGVVYVHCKAGYSRTAALAGAYLLASGLASDVGGALTILRRARPRIVIRPETVEALNDFRQELTQCRFMAPQGAMPTADLATS